MTEGWERAVADVLNQTAPRPNFEEHLYEALQSAWPRIRLGEVLSEDTSAHGLAVGAIAGALGLAGATCIAIYRRRHRTGAA